MNMDRKKKNIHCRSSLRASKKLKALTLNENNNSTNNNSGMIRGEEVIETSLDEGKIFFYIFISPSPYSKNY